jgi:hypothetical protein
MTQMTTLVRGSVWEATVAAAWWINQTIRLHSIASVSGCVPGPSSVSSIPSVHLCFRTHQPGPCVYPCKSLMATLQETTRSADVGESDHSVKLGRSTLSGLESHLRDRRKAKRCGPLGEGGGLISLLSADRYRGPLPRGTRKSSVNGRLTSFSVSIQLP